MRRCLAQHSLARKLLSRSHLPPLPLALLDSPLAITRSLTQSLMTHAPVQYSCIAAHPRTGILPPALLPPSLPRFLPHSLTPALIRSCQSNSPWSNPPTQPQRNSTALPAAILRHAPPSSPLPSLPCFTLSLTRYPVPSLLPYLTH